MTTRPRGDPDTDAVLTEQLKSLGFSDSVEATPRRLIVSSSGREKTGKTAFALTAPPPIVFFDIDVGTEGVISKFQAEGKRILVYRVRVPRQAKQDVYVPLWDDVKSRVARVYALRRGTVVFDTATEAYELCRLARFGRLTQVQPHNYVEVNNEWRELLRTAYDSLLNTVFVHKMKAVWIDATTSTGQIRSRKTGEFELAGFSEMGYLAQVSIEHHRADTEDGTVFSVFVRDSRHNPGAAGQLLEGLPLLRGESRAGDPLCNFDMLLSLIHGDGD